MFLKTCYLYLVINKKLEFEIEYKYLIFYQSLLKDVFLSCNLSIQI